MDQEERNRDSRGSADTLSQKVKELGRKNGGSISFEQIEEVLIENGLSKEDPRIRKFLEVPGKKDRNSRGKFSEEEFLDLLKKPEATVLHKALLEELAIPNFNEFKIEIEKIFNATKDETGGEMKDLLPHPAPGRQPAYAVSMCTVDGQLLQLGDHDLAFLLQSVSKPINYAIALEEVGKEKVHRHVGSEPGDESFDTGQVLNENDLPHNPMLTSGAIMTSALIQPDKDVDERLHHVMEVWQHMTGEKDVMYNEESYENEIKNSDRHFAWAHLMRHRQAFPKDVDLEAVIKFYLKCNALELNIDDLAHAAATLANYGKCPSTGKIVFSHDTVRDTLSLMMTSGMYDHSGEFAFQVGLPAKSGIAGGIMVVVPELMGISVYSPPLDTHGNSVRGVAFLEKLVETFNLHKYDAVGFPIHGKKDPRRKEM